MPLEYRPAWVTIRGVEHPGAVRAWRRGDDGDWWATVSYTIDLLQYQHSVAADQVRPRDED